VSSQQAQGTPRIGKAYVAALVGMLGASLALNVSLGWKVRRLGHYPAGAPVLVAPQAGSRIPGAFTAVDVKGNQETIALTGTRPTVLYVFSPVCRWCAANLANLTALVVARGRAYRFVGISLASFHLGEYIREHNLGFPVYTRPGGQIVRALHLGNTPQMIVVSPSGSVTADWVGAYGGTARLSVEKFFHIHLPGITG
jgi:hypothetical protein